MSTIFGLIVKVFATASVILAIAIAYAFGVMKGVNSQQWRIKELLEELHDGLIVDFLSWVHPLWYPLLSVAFIFGVCWIIIAVIVVQKKRNKNSGKSL